MHAKSTQIHHCRTVTNESNHGASRTKIYEVCPRCRRLQASRLLLTREMMERQGREQCLQVKVMSAAGLLE